MSGEVNMIPTLRKFRGGPVQANLGGASLETFSGEGQLKKSPCKLVLLDIRWYKVSKGLVCLYIWEKVEIWSGDTDASQTTEDSATQLVYSIKFKLSHAINAQS